MSTFKTLGIVLTSCAAIVVMATSAMAGSFFCRLEDIDSTGSPKIDSRSATIADNSFPAGYESRVLGASSTTGAPASLMHVTATARVSSHETKGTTAVPFLDVFRLVLCSTFILGGVCVAVYATCLIRRGVRARDWPHTNGRMLRVERIEHQEFEHGLVREIKVQYAYHVGGSNYEGATVHPMYNASTLEEEHLGVEKLLKSAKTVRVYYDPERPSRSTLSVGFYSSSLRMIIFSLVFMGAAVGLWLTAWSVNLGFWVMGPIMVGGYILLSWFASVADYDFSRGITVIE